VPGKNVFKSSLVLSVKRSGAMSRKKGSNSNGGGGFGDKKTPPSTSSSTDSNLQARDIYSKPALYDLAFGYRNYEEEVQFLLDVHEKHSKIDSPEKKLDILELAAGPARHTITALRDHSNLVNSCTAVDLCSNMVEYSCEIAGEELGDQNVGGKRDRFHYILDDMRSISNSQSSGLQHGSFDNAWILLGSMQHLTTNDDVINCFSSTSLLLKEGGTLTIELPHPRETFTMVECTRNGWEVPLEDENGKEYGELKIIWGDNDDNFDPIRQVRDFTVAMELIVSEDMKVDNPELQSVREIVPMRLFTYQEIDAFSRIAGFEVVELFGALSDEVNVNSEDEAFRLVCVLRKIRNPINI
jgi:SAM-dependent methyltransferase